MDGFLVTFAIVATATIIGLIIARFSSNTPREMTREEFAKQQRQFLNLLEAYERAKKERQGSSQQTLLLF